ncbi:putative metallophosphatase [Bodo saltans virus]|uniref:Metallophosphatase n=1 Tax=Bodo saltans virus TaxID=2024608 RepID=A0A2H4UW13_9VIRU|nr:putative metallophosphatase [Bodo saltans virus]ATZ81110.1 putative metallophosphatase [Bodo saltans virus]
MANIIKNIQFVSDIHLEFMTKIPMNLIIPSSKNLALLGDIGNPFSDIYEVFIHDVSCKFDNVFIIAGNHEYYMNDIIDTQKKIMEIEDLYYNVHFLDNKVYDFDNVRILGTTLWTKINKNASNLINDFRAIKYNGKKFQQRDMLKMHFDSLQLITQEMKNHKPLLILSHHAPHFKMNGIHEGNEAETAFATNLTSFIKSPIIGWLSGHTHQNIQMEINDIPLKSNCYGYNDQERYDYKNNMIFEIKNE